VLQTAVPNFVLFFIYFTIDAICATGMFFGYAYNIILFYYLLPGMVVHTCNPSTGEAEAGGLGVQGQPVLAT
jgi:hypothetical protein